MYSKKNRSIAIIVVVAIVAFASFNFVPFIASIQAQEIESAQNIKRKVQPLVRVPELSQVFLHPQLGQAQSMNSCPIYDVLPVLPENYYYWPGTLTYGGQSGSSGASGSCIDLGDGWDCTGNSPNNLTFDLPFD